MKGCRVIGRKGRRAVLDVGIRRFVGGPYDVGGRAGDHAGHDGADDRSLTVYEGGHFRRLIGSSACDRVGIADREGIAVAHPDLARPGGGARLEGSLVVTRACRRLREGDRLMGGVSGGPRNYAHRRGRRAVIDRHGDGGGRSLGPESRKGRRAAGRGGGGRRVAHRPHAGIGARPPPGPGSSW